MKTAKELREERAKMLPRLEELRGRANDEAQEWRAEDEANWTALNKDWDALTAQIQRAEKVERVDGLRAEQSAAVATAVAPGREDTSERQAERADGESREQLAERHNLAFRGWLRHAIGDPVPQPEAEAAQALGVRMGTEIQIRRYPRAPQSERDFQRMAERRAMTVSTGATGGFLVPEGFVDQFERAQLYFGGMRDHSHILRTASGEPLTWPTGDDTSNTGEQVGEGSSVTEDTTGATIGALVLGSYKFSSKMIKVNRELIRDSAVDIAGMLGEMLGERIGRITNTRFTTGTGNATCYGITVRATTGKTTASATAITGDEIIDLVHSVDKAYRVHPSTGFLMNDLIVAYVRKLKDGNSQYLWQPGLQGGVPDRLLTYPVTINNDMASTVVASAITMVFGQLYAYKIRDVGDIILRRLVERYAESDQEAFVAFSSHDGNLVTAGNPVKRMVQKSS